MARKSWKYFIENKKTENQEKITMITAYDYPSALICNDAGIDIILVGDSLSNVIQGNETTLPATLDEMIYHTKIVKKGSNEALVVFDMPFGSYEINPEKAVENAIRAIKETGADAVKLEGNHPEVVRKITAANIPVVCHLGLTPQAIKQMGGYFIQGKTNNDVEKLLKNAKTLEEAGASMLVLECVPAEVGEYITKNLSIPTIGIGAGNGTDGQVLVFHDLLGIYNKKPNKFVKQYANLYEISTNAIKQYVADVKEEIFPAEENNFKMKEKADFKKIY